MSDFNPVHQKLAAAVATLESMKYTWNGGVRWKPPLGKKPDFDLLDQKQADFDQLAQDYYKVIQERDALKAGAAYLINQVEMGTYTDELDHDLKDNQAFVSLKEKLNDSKGCVVVPVEPTPEMLDRAVAFALQVGLSSDYRWTDYMRDLYARFLNLPDSKPQHRRAING